MNPKAKDARRIQEASSDLEVMKEIFMTITYFITLPTIGIIVSIISTLTKLITKKTTFRK
jgi:hypothetical protein